MGDCREWNTKSKLQPLYHVRFEVEGLGFADWTSWFAPIWVGVRALLPQDSLILNPRPYTLSAVSRGGCQQV